MCNIYIYIHIYIVFGDEQTKTCCIPKKKTCMVYLSTCDIKTSQMWVTTSYMDDNGKEKHVTCDKLQDSARE